MILLPYYPVETISQNITRWLRKSLKGKIFLLIVREVFEGAVKVKGESPFIFSVKGLNMCRYMSNSLTYFTKKKKKNLNKPIPHECKYLT